MGQCRLAQAQLIAAQIDWSLTWGWVYAWGISSAVDNYMNQCGMNP